MKIYKNKNKEETMDESKYEVFLTAMMGEVANIAIDELKLRGEYLEFKNEFIHILKPGDNNDINNRTKISKRNAKEF